MKATHTNYKHPRHLRVTGCLGHKFHDGPCTVDVLCMSPSSSLYDKLNRSSLPCWREEKEPRP